jgi:hypothetical protein
MTNTPNINETTQVFGATNTKNPVGNEPSNGDKTNAFENALSKALNNSEASDMKPSANSALSEIASTGLNFINPSEVVSGKTNELLQMLESYSYKLEDPNISLKNIAPELEKILNNATNLQKEADALGKSEEDLKEIATQTIVTAQTEYLKFQRGDYLS